MANNVELGRQSTLYINTGTYGSPTWTEITLIRDVTMTDSRDKIDATTRATAAVGYKAQIYGLREFGWKFETCVPAAGETNNAYNALEAARKSGGNVDILHVEGGSLSTDGLPATRAVCGVFGGEKSEPRTDVSTRSYELSFILNQHQTVPQYGTTQNGGFEPGS